MLLLVVAAQRNNDPIFGTTLPTTQTNIFKKGNLRMTTNNHTHTKKPNDHFIRVLANSSKRFISAKRNDALLIVEPYSTCTRPVASKLSASSSKTSLAATVLSKISRTTILERFKDLIICCALAVDVETLAGSSGLLLFLLRTPEDVVGKGWTNCWRR